MDIFQRSTFATYNAYSLDRWYIGSSNNVTVTQSTAELTPNSQYMMLMTASTTQQIFAYQVIETKNAIYYAGKTVTLSAYAAGLTTTTNLSMVLQYSTSVDVGMGGSWTDITVASGNANLTLSSTVTRWSAQYAVPAAAKSLRVLFVNNVANITVGQGIYLGDVQLEVGSVATAFSRAGGTIQGELAACQRYLPAFNSNSSASNISGGYFNNTTSFRGIYTYQVAPRVAPTGIFISNTAHFTATDGGANYVGTNLTFGTASLQAATLNCVISGATISRAGLLFCNNASGQILFTGCEL